MTPAEQEAEWQAELVQTEADIAKWQSILDTTKAGTASLQRDASILNAKIKQAQDFIKQKNIAIQQLQSSIDQKNQVIGDLENQIESGHESLAQILRQEQQLDDTSLPEVFLSGQNLSDFFSDIDYFYMIKKSLADLFAKILANETLVEQAKADLSTQKDKETDTKMAMQLQQQQVQSEEKQKEYLITINKKQEKTYQQVLNEREAAAAKIRAALFSLRDTAAIPFGDALKFAQEAQTKTGVDPAFLLAILTQESNLGKNVGTCNRSGDPPSKSWKNIMPGPNSGSSRDDQSAYLRITSALGLNPDTMPLSCPIGGTGWGGAMGPAQFIPTTWELYEPKIEAAVGRSTVSPWNPEDAFMASAIYLSELGASGGGYTAERNAALKYYAGANWRRAANAFYGNQVMARASSIQTTMIDPLANL